jgi:hypothetical protein
MAPVSRPSQHNHALLRQLAFQHEATEKAVANSKRLLPRDTSIMGAGASLSSSAACGTLVVDDVLSCTSVCRAAAAQSHPEGKVGGVLQRASLSKRKLAASVTSPLVDLNVDETAFF